MAYMDDNAYSNDYGMWVPRAYMPKEEINFGDYVQSRMREIIENMSLFLEDVYTRDCGCPICSPPNGVNNNGKFVVDGEVEDPVVGKGTQMIDGKWQPKGFLGPAGESPQPDEDD